MQRRVAGEGVLGAGGSTKAELGRGELEGAEGELGAGGDTHNRRGPGARGPAKGYPRASGEWATPTESFASSHAELKRGEQSQLSGYGTQVGFPRLDRLKIQCLSFNSSV